jgi:hypothetical protein
VGGGAATGGGEDSVVPCGGAAGVVVVVVFAGRFFFLGFRFGCAAGVVAVRVGVSFDPAVIGSDDSPTSGLASREAAYDTPTAISRPAIASAAQAIFMTSPR